MPIKRFILNSFIHYLPPESLPTYLPSLVGRYVILRANDANPMDRYCVDGWVDGAHVCHVRHCEAQMVREVMRQCGKRSLKAKVVFHNLDKGYKTVVCELEVPSDLCRDIAQWHRERYDKWTYRSVTAPETTLQQELHVCIDFLSEALWDDDMPVEELHGTLQAYLQRLPMTFAAEDKEACVALNTRIQESPLAAVRAYAQPLCKAQDYLNHPEQREALVRRWLDEFKACHTLAYAAREMDAGGLAALEGNLRDFPDGLYAVYRHDFPTFAGNLFYNDIPAQPMQEFLSGVALVELVRQRLSDEVRQPCPRDPLDITLTLRDVKHFMDRYPGHEIDRNTLMRLSEETLLEHHRISYQPLLADAPDASAMCVINHFAQDSVQMAAGSTLLGDVRLGTEPPPAAPPDPPSGLS